ncbi:MAG: MFS transporter [Cardiobacteriaceae bacterium]|nr:MFS transporter [Cardiobacteriaceae bacterium]
MNDEQTSNKKIISPAFIRRMAVCVFTGFTSGMPLFVLLSLLPIWLRDNAMNLDHIAKITAAAMLPYSLKFLWAWSLDIALPFEFVGRRKFWTIITQLLLLLLTLLFLLCNPKEDFLFIATIAAFFGFISATADIAIDAYRREILPDRELGLGNSLHINAYRISKLIPGALGLVLADIFSWQAAFLLCAATIFAMILAVIFIFPEPQREAKAPRTFEESVVLPFVEFFRRQGKNAFFILIFLVLYKFGDSLATTMQSTFIVDMHYSKIDIAKIEKLNSLWASVLGAFIGGVVMLKIGINRSLWIFGVVQMITILGFYWLACSGPFNAIGAWEKWQLGIVIAGEYLGVGLGTAAFVAFIARETNPAYAASQLALFTSLTALPRTIFGAVSGFLVEGGKLHGWQFAGLGYANFFLLCFFLAFPGMLLLFKVAKFNEPQSS